MRVHPETKVVWREWYDEAAVKALTEMGTLPREETMLNIMFENGEDVAGMIAEECNKRDGEHFREGGDIVILEPAEFAGTYRITTEYEPVFYARKEEL